MSWFMKAQFRWTCVYWLTHPKYAIQSFFERIGKLIRYFPIIWCDEDYDWTYIYCLLAYKLQRMSDGFYEWGHHVNSDNYAREMKIAAALCKRIADSDYIFLNKDSYCGNPKLGPWLQQGMKWKGHNQAPYFYDDYMLKQDLEYLHRLLTRKVRSWWD